MCSLDVFSVRELPNLIETQPVDDGARDPPSGLGEGICAQTARVFSRQRFEIAPARATVQALIRTHLCTRARVRAHTPIQREEEEEEEEEERERERERERDGRTDSHRHTHRHTHARTRARAHTHTHTHTVQLHENASMYLISTLPTTFFGESMRHRTTAESLYSLLRDKTRT